MCQALVVRPASSEVSHAGWLDSPKTTELLPTWGVPCLAKASGVCAVGPPRPGSTSLAPNRAKPIGVFCRVLPLFLDPLIRNSSVFPALATT